MRRPGWIPPRNWLVVQVVLAPDGMTVIGQRLVSLHWFRHFADSGKSAATENQRNIDERDAAVGVIMYPIKYDVIHLVSPSEWPPALRDVRYIGEQDEAEMW